MAINPTAPGVYIEEIVTLPASVAPVATAIPAFIGYTEKGPANVPTRITSLLEYEATFGGPLHEKYTINVSGTGTGDSPAVGVSVTSQPNYILYYSLQMFFANGGGTCWIISIGGYGTAINVGDFTSAGNGIDAAEKVDEITILVAPEAIYLSDANRKTVYDQMLGQCNKLQDRFSVLDVEQDQTTVKGDADKFRSDNIGINYLKYGAAYYPKLKTPLVKFYSDTEVEINDTRTVPIFTAFPNKNLSTVFNGKSSYSTVTVAPAVATGKVIINGIPLIGNIDFVIVAGDENVTAVNLRNAINAHPVLSGVVYAAIDSAALDEVAVVALNGEASGGGFVSIADMGDFTSTAIAPGVNGTADTTLYNRISAELSKFTLDLYPSSTMAGVYASVDRNRGVWKAPANVSLNLVSQPAVFIDTADNGLLNVDPTAGKSINAIRQFAGKGTLVWGARTLAGNDNEWRYVNVRRLFIFAEESIKKATEFVVFEPNDANTWSRTKSLITNFLTNLWRDGALAGAKTEHAFFVKVGLNETMTAQDILEGKLIIEIGMAAVRPAEFIIMKFMHKLQES